MINTTTELFALPVRTILYKIESYSITSYMVIGHTVQLYDSKDIVFLGKHKDYAQPIAIVCGSPTDPSLRYFTDYREAHKDMLRMFKNRAKAIEGRLLETADGKTT